MRLKNRTEEIREEYRRVGEELGSFKTSHRVAAEKAFIDAGGCDKCRGRGWVVTWDTLDCIQGSYAQYASCPSENCTPATREKSGLAPRNRFNKYKKDSLISFCYACCFMKTCNAKCLQFLTRTNKKGAIFF